MVRHMQQKFNTFDFHTMTKTVRITSSTLSRTGTLMVRNVANDAFDQKFGDRNKNQLPKCYD